MGIIDWLVDVCSSDLNSSSKIRSSDATRRSASPLRSVQTSEERLPVSGRIANGPEGRKCSCAPPSCGRSWDTVVTMPDWMYSHRLDRNSEVYGKRVSVRVSLGVCGIIKRKKKK